MNLTDSTVRAQAGYTYDTAGRVATVGDGGDTLTYAYAPGTSRVASTAWTTATGNNTAYTYDSYHRLTGIAVNNTSVYGYTLNDKDQRTGATLENGDNWAYAYDTLGQLTGALKKDSQDNTLNNMSYAFDLIGNRTTATEDAANWTYASNLLNQYTQVNALVPTYDTDGNMLTWNGWTYTWNGENRLVCAENDDTKVEMGYDYMGRRFEKKVYTKGLLNLYTWTLQKHRKFAYDGYKLIAEFDAMNNDALLANYLWQPVGLDVPLRATIDGDACYFVADGNKNIIALKDATGATTDDYTYTPFGAVTASGSTDNPYRFSSEYHDAETGLVYYNYRYYSPTLGRWTKRDSIEETGGAHLYSMVSNDSINVIDKLGLKWIFQDRDPEQQWRLVIRTKPDDSVSELANRVQLYKYEAFGDRGWLRKKYGSVFAPVPNRTYIKSNDRCFEIPNVVAIVVGSGPNVSDLNKSLQHIFRDKGFFVSPIITGPDVYGVIYMGHFDTPTGLFLKNGRGFASTTHRDLYEAVGHKIFFFAGIGCMSKFGHWDQIATKLWVTGYTLQAEDANDPKLSIYSERIDKGQSKESIDPLYGHHMGGLEKGNSGILLSTWVQGIE